MEIHTEITDGCWLWTGWISPTGYGSLKVRKKNVYAHRLAYELAHGPIPAGYQIDHLCRVRNCVNPSHLEAVTQRENLLRGDTIVAKHWKKTHCIHGHEFTAENTYTYSGGRVCRACVVRRRKERSAALALKSARSRRQQRVS